MLRLSSKVLLTVLLIQLSLVSEASDSLNTECKITPAIWSEAPFGEKIIKNNNLRRKTGSPNFAEGEFIDITGKILDSNCVPISEAVVEIQQADASGNMPIDENLTDKVPYFAYTGTAITDNLGYFHFFTVFPGTKNSQAPRIHFRVKHPDFLPFETYMYFPNNNLNNFDFDLKNLVDKQEESLLISTYTEAGSVAVSYNFNMTLEGVNKYKRY